MPDKRVLMVDGPLRGWDIPYKGGVWIVVPLPNGPQTYDEARYRVEPVRTRSGEIFMLGFLDEDFTYRAVKPPACRPSEGAK